MNELHLYELFANILGRSKTISGRFVVAEGYGNDLNANSFDNHISNALTGIVTPRKYPVAVLLPPVEVVEPDGRGWSNFQLKMFFLTTTYHDGLADIKGIAGDSNTSKVPAMADWAQMRKVAGEFMKMFKEFVRNYGITDGIRDSQKTAEVYERYSMMNNDRLSGVCLNFEVQLFTDCEEIEDYEPGSLLGLRMPEINP